MSPALRRRLAPFLLSPSLASTTCLAAEPPFTLAYTYHLPTPRALDAGAINVITNDFTFDGYADVVVSFREAPLMLFVGQMPSRGGFLPKPLSAFHGFSSPVLDHFALSAGAPHNAAGRVNDIVYAHSAHGVRRVQWVGGLANYAATPERIELPPYGGVVGIIGNFIAGDFNGDQRTDVAIVDLRDENSQDGRSSGVIAWGQVGLPTIERALPTVPNPYAMAAADFTGDAAHLTDLLIADRTNRLGVTTYDPATRRLVLAYTLTIPDAVAITSIAAGDLDGDGRSDAIVNYRTAGSPLFATAMLENRAGEGLVPGKTGSFDYAMTSCIADFNADGVPDLLLDGRRLQLGRGNYRFDATPPVVYEATYGVACADFNQDGYRDFAVAMHGAEDTMELRIYQYRNGWDRLFANGFDATP